jgi:hypothetical protein
MTTAGDDSSHECPLPDEATAIDTRRRDQLDLAQALENSRSSGLQWYNESTAWVHAFIGDIDQDHSDLGIRITLVRNEGTWNVEARGCEHFIDNWIAILRAPDDDAHNDS